MYMYVTMLLFKRPEQICFGPCHRDWLITSSCIAGNGRDHNYIIVVSFINLSLQLHARVRLQWRRCADVPLEMSRAKAIVVGEKVYVGGGYTSERSDRYKFFQYNWRGDTWSTLPRCPVECFGMAYFMGRIITVGGVTTGVDLQISPTDKVHSLREDSQQWEEFLTPLPTVRWALSAATTSAAVIAAGGYTGSHANAISSAVEVYSSDTSQWHTADPLPKPCAWMSSVTINDICYLLGGKDQNDQAVKTCWYASLHSLVHKAVSHSDSSSVWSCVSSTPLKWSTAACLSGSLVIVGGISSLSIRSSAVYGFLNNSWARLRNGDLLSPQAPCATAQLSPVEVIVIGGWDEEGEEFKTVSIGTLHW